MNLKKLPLLNDEWLVFGETFIQSRKGGKSFAAKLPCMYEDDTQ